MRITFVVSGFPTREDPRRGVFNMRARDALSCFADVNVVFLRAWIPGRPHRQLDRFAGSDTTVVFVPQIPAGPRLGNRFSIAANIVLYRMLGWPAARDRLTGADIVHSVDALVGMVASQWAAKLGKRHVTQVIGSDLNTVLPSVRGAAGRGWEKWLHGVVCNSSELAARFSALYPAVPNVRAIYRGVDFATFNPDGPCLGPQAMEAPVRFAFFGGFIRQTLQPKYVKGGPMLLSAWRAAEAQLAKTGASLLLAGPKSRSGMVASWRKQLLYPERVHLAGELLPSEMPGYLRATDAVVVPSYAEGLPNVCMEASACGRGVLASGIGGIPEVVINDETGIILPPGDVEAWARALVECAARPDRLNDMGRRGRARVQRLFDSRDYGRKLAALYDDVVSIPMTGMAS